MSEYTERLKKMDVGELTCYFNNENISSSDIIYILNELSIPVKKMSRPKLIEHASESISGLGMFQRISDR